MISKEGMTQIILEGNMSVFLSMLLFWKKEKKQCLYCGQTTIHKHICKPCSDNRKEKLGF